MENALWKFLFNLMSYFLCSRATKVNALFLLSLRDFNSHWDLWFQVFQQQIPKSPNIIWTNILSFPFSLHAFFNFPSPCHQLMLVYIKWIKYNLIYVTINHYHCDNAHRKCGSNYSAERQIESEPFQANVASPHRSVHCKILRREANGNDAKNY